MFTQNLIKSIKNCLDYYYIIVLHYFNKTYKPKFTCEIITPEKIYEVHDEGIKYHNKNKQHLQNLHYYLR